MNRYVLLFTCTLCVPLLVGCSATEVTETTWSASPGGEWLTRIVREDTSGPGNSYLAETVQLKRRTAEKPVDVLTLSQNHGPATIKVIWRDPTNLTLDHTGGTVVFQVVKLGELSIETR